MIADPLTMITSRTQVIADPLAPITCETRVIADPLISRSLVNRRWPKTP
jgi:hypothetical protein